MKERIRAKDDRKLIFHWSSRKRDWNTGNTQKKMADGKHEFMIRRSAIYTKQGKEKEVHVGHIVVKTA